MPVRSSGCLTCRKRKIRCDESRPGCQRCTTHGVECPGYRTDKPGGIEFKDQTNTTVDKAEKQYKTKAARSRWRAAINGSSSSDQDDGIYAIDEDASSTTLSGDSSGSGSTQASPRGHLINKPPDQLFTQAQALILANTTKGPASLFSPNSERARLYNEFIATYLPRDASTAQNGHFSFFQTLALKRSDQPALQQSFDALSLVQIGSIFKDQALLKQAVKQYSRAVGSLARSISKGDFLRNDDVLAAVTVLAACELYEEIADMGEGWTKHVEGSNQLVAARGPESLQSELALLLYSNMRHGSLCHAVIARKEPFLAKPEWRAVAFRVPLLDPSTLFYDIALQIPGLLQQHDELELSSAEALADIDAILVDSDKLETELRDWFADWQTHAGVQYDLQPIDDFPTFTALCADRTFNHAYMFADFLVAYLHSMYWMMMFYLRSNTQALHRHRHKLIVDWYPDTKSVVPEDELLQYILNLCQCMPFFTEPISSSVGSVGIFLPLRTAAQYFTQHGQWAWLKWIGSVRNSVFVKGLIPPNIRDSMD